MHHPERRSRLAAGDATFRHFNVDAMDHIGAAIAGGKLFSSTKAASPTNVRKSCARGLQSMLQATVCDGGALDAPTFCEHHLSPAEIDIGGSEVVDALMIAHAVIMLDEGIDLLLQVSRQI
jgi:hypothetical protein